MSITKEKKTELIKKFKEHEKDTGSSTVQVAVLTERINNLTEHFKIHAKDQGSRRGLLQMVGQRRKLLSYIKKQDLKKYNDLIASLNLRK
ncbi:MAG: 30S ribosomal protein S15 [Elusimicrobiota bacterium]